MRILVVSDIHGDSVSLEYLLKKEKYEAVVFCGDGLRDISAAEPYYPAIPFYTVRGNCDFTYAPPSFLTCFDGVAVFALHGDEYGVKSGLSQMISQGKSRQADIIVFGHTHRALISEEEGITVMNPGSLGYGKTYGIIEAEKGSFRCEIKDLY